MSVIKSLELDVILEQVKKYCSFSLGNEMIESLMPNFDPLIIRREHAYMKEAIAMCIHEDRLPMLNIKDLRTVLENAKKGRTLSASELVDEMFFIQGVRGIQIYFESMKELPHDNLADIYQTLVVHDKIAKEIGNCLNQYGEVMDKASSELRSIRSSISHTDSEIMSAANRFVSTHTDSVVDSIITNRNGRVVILVKASDKNMYGGLLHGDSASGQASYIEPNVLVNLNNRKMELLEKEKEEIHRILTQLSQLVAGVADEEIYNVETCGILDAIFAKAQWGKVHEGVAAELTEDKNIEIDKAKHPLIDPKKVVSNNYHLQDPRRILLITGPNTGGKTVSMKVIGLFVLMTYVGIPVTAEYARIPYFDNVFVDIGDDQSVVESLSSFSAHIKKQAEIVNQATENSLVLMDEIGSGTDPKEGESLAISILNYLRELHTMCVVTTHYGRLKAYGKRHDDILVASVQFDQEKLMPTYRFIEGLSGQSNAFDIARRYGLPNHIIKYASFLKEQAKTQEDELIARLEVQLNETTLKNDALNQRLKEVEQLEKSLIKQRNDLLKEKDMLQQKAQQEANLYIEKAQQEADEILANMRQQQAKYHEVLNMRSKLTQLQSQPETSQEEIVDVEYHVGDAVELRSSNQVCEIVKIGRKEITISLNGRLIHVKKNQIRPSSHVIPKVKANTSVNIRSSNIFSSMPSECNLIGMHVDEGITKMIEYIDQAKVHGLKTFRIIHGDGTGKLRKAVHEKLRNDKSVKEFRLGMPQEGGTGATVVTLN
ncbi:MAG: endonuclease MutS2 [Erysipelotrichaceae bacterium]|nr:endonuclease MutS2 [Erysipelotrichaceae bacterium]